MKIRLLDIDLDFFLNRKAHSVTTSTARLDEQYYQPWEESKVLEFMEQRCGLTTDQPIPGRIFTHHDEVFYFLRDLQSKNDNLLEFAIDHIDAHADLGQGDASFKYISTDVLFKPASERQNIDKFNGYEGLSAGNYLAFAIACRWIASLNYINRKDWSDDVFKFHFRDCNPSSGLIELKKYTDEVMKDMMGRGPVHEVAHRFPPLELEPPVPFRAIDISDFQSDGNYDYILLTQSPGFTPLASDSLIPLISQYMEPDFSDSGSLIDFLDEECESEDHKLHNSIAWHELGHLTGHLIAERLGYNFGSVISVDLSSNAKISVISPYNPLGRVLECLDKYGYKNMCFDDEQDIERIAELVKDKRMTLAYISYLVMGGLFNIYAIKQDPDVSDFEDCFTDSIELYTPDGLTARAGNDWSKVRRLAQIEFWNIEQLKMFRAKLFILLKDRVFDLIDPVIKLIDEQYNGTILQGESLDDIIKKIGDVLEGLTNDFWIELTAIIEDFESRL